MFTSLQCILVLCRWFQAGKKTSYDFLKKRSRCVLLFIWNKKILECCFQFNDNECSKVLMPSKNLTTCSRIYHKFLLYWALTGSSNRLAEQNFSGLLGKLSGAKSWLAFLLGVLVFQTSVYVIFFMYLTFLEFAINPLFQLNFPFFVIWYLVFLKLSRTNVLEL